MTAVPCDLVQEYMVPADITAVRVELESGGPNGHSRGTITLQVQPTATFRVRLIWVPSHKSPGDPSSIRGSEQ